MGCCGRAHDQAAGESKLAPWPIVACGGPCSVAEGDDVDGCVARVGFPLGSLGPAVALAVGGIQSLLTTAQSGSHQKSVTTV